MGIVYICIVLIIIGCLLVWVSDNTVETLYENLLSIGIVAPSIILAIFLSLLWATDRNVDQTRYDYIQLKVLIQSEQSLHQIERDQLYQRIHLMNRSIDVHKSRHTNWLIGILYSSEIANLEYLR